MSTTVKRVILYIIEFIAIGYVLLKGMNYGYEWGELFVALAISAAVAFVCHTLAGVLKKLDELDRD